MSNKPPKHSDRTRPWRAPVRKSAAVRYMEMSRHLIVCEGTVTEPNYFKGVKCMLTRQNGRKIDIEVVGTGAHTLGLLHHAVSICESAPDTYSDVWVCFDLDDFSAKQFDQVVTQCANMSADAGPTTYHALWSNPCFEVWLLFHFGFTTAPISTAECQQRLSKSWKAAFDVPYKKNLQTIFALTAPKLDNAAKNTALAAAFHAQAGNDKPSEMNPQSSVQEFFEAISDYLKA